MSGCIVYTFFLDKTLFGRLISGITLIVNIQVLQLLLIKNNIFHWVFAIFIQFVIFQPQKYANLIKKITILDSYKVHPQQVILLKILNISIFPSIFIDTREIILLSLQ